MNRRNFLNHKEYRINTASLIVPSVAKATVEFD